MKKVFSFSIDDDVIKDLDVYCKEGLITKSKLINKILRDYIEKNKEEQHDNLQSNK